jgi:hypothetical protein
MARASVIPAETQERRPAMIQNPTGLSRIAGFVGVLTA